MFNTQDCVALFTRKMGKSFNDLADSEKAILADVVYDSKIGRYSKFLMWSSDVRTEFLDWLSSLGVVYHNLSDAERWAYEDAFEMPDTV